MWAISLTRMSTSRIFDWKMAKQVPPNERERRSGQETRRKEVVGGSLVAGWLKMIQSFDLTFSIIQVHYVRSSPRDDSVCDCFLYSFFSSLWVASHIPVSIVVVVVGIYWSLWWWFVVQLGCSMNADDHGYERSRFSSEEESEEQPRSSLIIQLIFVYWDFNGFTCGRSSFR